MTAVEEPRLTHEEIAALPGINDEITDDINDEIDNEEDVYEFYKLHPAPITMTKELIRRKEEEILRKKHEIPKDKSSTIL